MHLQDVHYRAFERAIKDKIVASKQGEDWYTNSKSGDGFHKVISRPAGYLCNCTGFIRWGMCKHIAAVMMQQLIEKEAIICELCGEFMLWQKPILVSEYEDATNK
jgi:hypothetical protein